MYILCDVTTMGSASAVFLPLTLRSFSCDYTATIVVSATLARQVIVVTRVGTQIAECPLQFRRSHRSPVCHPVARRLRELVMCRAVF